MWLRSASLADDGKGAELWATTPDGTVALEVTLRYA